MNIVTGYNVDDVHLKNTRHEKFTTCDLISSHITKHKRRLHFRSHPDKKLTMFCQV